MIYIVSQEHKHKSIMLTGLRPATEKNADYLLSENKRKEQERERILSEICAWTSDNQEPFFTSRDVQILFSDNEIGQIAKDLISSGYIVRITTSKYFIVEIPMTRVAGLYISPKDPLREKYVEMGFDIKE